MQAPILNDAQFEQVLFYADQMERPGMYRLLVQITRATGLRPMELAGMETTWLRGDHIRIPVGHSKRKSGRTVPASPELMDALYGYLQGREGRVFLNKYGEPFTANGISEAMRRLYRLAGVQGSCYSGRRTMATRMVDNGVNIAVVSKVLGHSNIATTQNYIGVTDAMMRQAMYG